MRERLAAMAVAALASLSLAVPAHAGVAASADTSGAAGLTEFNHITYVGELRLVTADDEGNSYDFRWAGTRLTIVCDGDTCSLLVEGGSPNALAASSGVAAREVLSNYAWLEGFGGDAPGAYAASVPGTGSMCADMAAFAAPSTRTLTADAQTLSLRDDRAEVTERCSASEEITFFSARITLTGEYAEGNPCVLEGAECPPLEPSPVVEAIIDDLLGTDDGLATEGSTGADDDAAGTGADGVGDDAAGGLAGSASRIATGGAAAPSVLSALIPIQERGITMLEFCLAALATSILSLLVVLPRRLLDSAVGAVPRRWAAFQEWLRTRGNGVARRFAALLARPREPRRGQAQDQPEAEPNHGIGSAPWRKAAAGVAAAAIISSFVDPGFGFNPGSARVALSISAAFFLNVVVGWSVAIWIARRVSPGLTASYQFKPLTLLVVALAVLFTRLTHFEPGIIFGLVAGVVLGAAASKAVDAKVSLAQTGYAFSLGLAGWAAYSALSPALAGTGNVLARLLIDTLAGFATAGFAAAPIALLPVAGMGGLKLYEWSRRAWLAAYSVGLLGFLLVLMPMPGSWREVSFSLRAWMTLYLAYVAVGLIAWLALVRPWERDSARSGGGDDGAEVEMLDVEA